jgi:hypothetical protein
MLRPLLISRREKEENIMATNWKKGTMPLVSKQVNTSEHAFTWQGLLSLVRKNGPHDEASRSFLLQVVQPGLSGLMDGSVRDPGSHFCHGLRLASAVHGLAFLAWHRRQELASVWPS